MKKKNILLISLVIALFIIMIYSLSKNQNNEILVSEVKDKKKNSASIAMMYEKNADTGEYLEKEATSWLGEGYVFNSELSKCVNGSKISYDSKENIINVESNEQDKCYVYFDKYVYHKHCDETLFACKVAKTINEDSLLLHNEDLIGGAEDGSYRFNGGDYRLTQKALNAGYTIIADNLITLTCDGSLSNLGLTCPSTSTYYYSLAYDTTKKQYTSYKEVLNQAVSDGYLTKDNVKNFVCFGSSESSCPLANLYRVIGIFDGQVKLIKYDYAAKEQLGDASVSKEYEKKYTSSIYTGNKEETAKGVDRYYWNYVNYNKTYNENGYYNLWSYSALNNQHLNGYYLTYLGDWANKIATTTWRLGGLEAEDLSANNVYKAEIINNTTVTHSAKVGLVYLSDYLYALDKDNWKINFYNSNATAMPETISNNWMYGGTYEWTISRNANGRTVYRISFAGGIQHYNVNSPNNAVRPVFSLLDTVKYVSGSGTMDDSYRIN